MFVFLKRTFVVLLGLLLIVILIWFGGPLVSIAGLTPLETETARLIAIAAVIGFWLIVRLFKKLRAFRASDRLLAAVVAQPQPHVEKARTPADVVKLRERFEEAVAGLKQQRRSGHSLYELPWYVIIGPPGSGKTTALLNSGLRFPLEQRVGKGALRGVGGTRNCDWWFTDQAVFLDTAGRYTTQDSDAESDSVGWSEFLALLKKYRPRRPLNGVILTVSAKDLLTLDPISRETMVEAARNRLTELNRELRIQLPVYVMVTKCDLVDGFAEYFEDLSAGGRAQVWGVTFPYEQTLANESPELYSSEFDALMTRLNERVFERMEDERDVRRRTKVFAFPQQMATLRDALTQWVTDVFGAREFDGQVLLRGVYFTSGTQEGTPIDRLLGSIGRTFGSGDAVTAPRGPGKAYFVENLLKQVMIGESGLAGVNRRLELRNASLLLGAYIATGLLAAAGAIALTVSYRHNSRFLDQIAADIAAFDQTPEVTPSSPIDAIVARLDGIRAILDSADRYQATTSLLMRWGLYEGRSIGKSARDAYVRELDSVLLPRFAGQIRSRVVQYASEPQKLYAYFKGYVMLGEPRHLDKDHLARLADLEWKQGSDESSTAGPSLSHHFAALLENASTLRALPLDGVLVGQVRNSLPRTLMPRVLYDQIKRASMDEGGPGLRIDQLAGLDSDRVFRRKSGVPLSTPIPRLYTPATFKELTTKGRAVLLQQMTADAWVWGDSAASSLRSTGTLVTEVTNLYEQDYATQWEALLDDLQFVPLSTIPHTVDALRIVTAPTSPLRGLLTTVANNTTLVQPSATGAPQGVVDQTTKKVTDVLGNVLKPAQGALGMAAVEPGLFVTNRFQWVRQLTAGEPGKTQLDGILKSLDDIRRQLETLGPDVAGARPVDILANPSFRALMQTLEQQAVALPRGVRDLVTDIAINPGAALTREATDEIGTLYRQLVVPTCNSLIANRYPFAPSSAEVQLADFATVFGYDGLFDRFFTQQLEKQVDMSGADWSWRPGSVQLSERLLDQFQHARRIRDMFFNPGSKTPELQFFVTFSDLDSNAQRVVLQIDGKNFDDKHMKQAGTWPGPVPGHAATTFESRYYDPTRAYGGPWAWFRMIDDTRVGAPDAQQRIMLNIQNRYHRVHVTVEPGRADANPFAVRNWRQFRCEP
jgi:type VI secretion system protein ImpL